MKMCDGNHGGPPCIDPACWNPYPRQLPAINKFHIFVYANGWTGKFNLPETHLRELISYLTERVIP